MTRPTQTDKSGLVRVIVLVQFEGQRTQGIQFKWLVGENATRTIPPEPRNPGTIFPLPLLFLRPLFQTSDNSTAWLHRPQPETERPIASMRPSHRRPVLLRRPNAQCCCGTPKDKSSCDLTPPLLWPPDNASCFAPTPPSSSFLAYCFSEAVRHPNWRWKVVNEAGRTVRRSRSGSAVLQSISSLLLSFLSYHWAMLLMLNVPEP